MLGMDATTGKPLAGRAHLAQSVANILATRLATLVTLREYGSDLPRLVDRPLGQPLVMRIYAAVAGALMKWEPRIKIDSMRLEEAGAGFLTFSLSGTYLPDDEPIILAGVRVAV